MSGAERLVWSAIHRNQLDGHRFRRQHPIGPYVVDFICLAAKLVIEVDGSHHCEPEQIAHDAARSRWLENEGYRVIRFPTTDIHANLDGILLLIRDALAARASSPLRGEDGTPRI